MPKKNPTVIDLTPVPTEDEEQIAVMQWAAYQIGRWPDLIWLFHIPNGGKRSKVEAARFKAMGVKPGVPDLCLPVPKNGYHGLYIEMKRREGGKLSADQRKWIEGLQGNGYCVHRCDGCHEAEAVLEAYLRGKIKREE